MKKLTTKLDELIELARRVMLDEQIEGEMTDCLRYNQTGLRKFEKACEKHKADFEKLYKDIREVLEVDDILIKHFVRMGGVSGNFENNKNVIFCEYNLSKKEFDTANNYFTSFIRDGGIR